jgi:hypothetical protein
VIAHFLPEAPSWPLLLEADDADGAGGAGAAGAAGEVGAANAGAGDVYGQKIT